MAEEEKNEITVNQSDFWESDKKGIADKIVGRLVSRKLMVWATATWALLFTGNLTSSDWVTISLVYIGSQAAIDLAVAWKSGSHG
tara:strand:- start:9 stop:263 length:255 start_codon:yes stop_codon:yes gene_type:complete